MRREGFALAAEKREGAAVYGLTKDNLSQFAYTNEELLTGPVRGINLDFHGLDLIAMLSGYDERVRRFAAEGILHITPYDNPWSWMNDVAVRTADALLDTAIEKYGLTPDVPITSTGGSMGGLGALIFPLHTRHRVVACAANCPVCDLFAAWEERRDIPRTLLSAFGHYDQDLETAMRGNSPLWRAEAFPDIPYYLVHGAADQAVHKNRHTDLLVPRLRAAGRDVTYIEVEGMEHCAMPGDVAQGYDDFIVAQLIGLK